MKTGSIQRKTCLLGIILITLAAVGARIVGLGYDDLVAHNHDERIHLFTAEQIYQGIYNPRQIWETRRFLYVFYPWISMYIVAGFYHLYDLVRTGYGFIAGWLIFLAGEGGSYLKEFSPPEPGLDSRQALYLGRLTVALIGAANIPLLYLVGKKLFNRRTGLLAAALLALNGYHIANCHWLKNDIIAAFFLTAAFFYAVRIFLRGKPLDYLLAAALAAVAINTKHYNAPILASCLFAHLLAPPRTTFRGLPRRLLERKFLLFVLAFLVFFVVSYPLFYLDFGYIVSHFREMAARTQTDAMFGSLGRQARPRTFFQIRRDNLINFARFSWQMVAGIGPYVLLLGLAGAAAAVWSRNKRLLLAASFPLAYLPAAVLVASPGVRYQDVIPLNPFFALLAAALITLLLKAVCGRKRWLAAALFPAVSIALLSPYFLMVVRMNYGYWERSARYYASDWAARHIPPGSSLIRESKTLWLDDSRYDTVRVRALWSSNVDALADYGVDYLVTSSRYESRALEPTGLFGPGHPYGQFYLSLPTRYDLVKEFDLGEIPYRGGSSKIWQRRTDSPPVPRGINSALLRRLQHDLSFSSPGLLLPGPGGLLEGTTAFIVPPQERIGRRLISPAAIPRLGVQVVNGPEAGRIRIRYGLEKITKDFAAGQVRQVVIAPRAGFPFIHHSYHISVAAPWNSAVLVRLLTDPYRIGLGYYELGEYGEAAGWLEEACRMIPEDWYPRALLAAVWDRKGYRDRADFYRSEAERLFPGQREFIFRLGDDQVPGEVWREEFQRRTGICSAWLAERAGRVWDDGEWEEESGPGGERRIELGDFYLLPGDYRIRFRGDAAEDDGRLTVRLYGGEDLLQSWKLPGVEPEFVSSGLAERYSLVVDDHSGGLREILVHPSVDSVRSRLIGYLRNLNLSESAN